MMRILIAEDSGPSRLVLERTLTKWGYDVVSCRDGASAWNELQKDEAPRLVILDWMMPGLSGPEICRLVRQRQRDAYTYILLLTSRTQKEDLVAGMESGADDYVTKPFDQNELNVRLNAGTRVLQLQSELLAAKEQLRELATRDSLTGIWNRRSIMELLEREQLRSSRESTPLAVVMLDLDHFKSVNDTYGHIVGDAVLQEAARRLTTSVRPYDGVGRYGGEEFLVVLPGCDENTIRNRAESMRLSIESEAMVSGPHRFKVTASFGVTVFWPGQAHSASHMIRLADEALYAAKKAGRNRVCVRSSIEALDPQRLAHSMPADFR